MANDYTSDRDDNVQHGIDDNPNNDAEKGAALGGLGGAVTGAAAGAILGPGGALLGGAIGAVAGAVASGLGVAAVDRIDNDNTVSGLGGGATRDANDTASDTWNTAKADARGDVNAVRSDVSGSGQTGYVRDTDLPGSTTNAERTDTTYLGSAGAAPMNTGGTDVNDRYDDVTLTDADRTNYRGFNQTEYDSLRAKDYNTLNEDDRRTLRLHTEHLSATKTQVQAGEVTLHKEVITENQTITVPTTREEVVIERHAVTGATAGDVADFRDGEEIRIPVMKEEVQVTKTPVVTEEVSLGKREITENQTFTDTVRREEARLDNASNLTVENADNLNTDVDREETTTTGTSTGSRNY